MRRHSTVLKERALDRYKFTTIGHGEHRLCSPIGEDRFGRWIEMLALSPSDRVIDIAAGKAELSIRLIEHYGVSAVAVEQSPHFVKEARAAATSRTPDCCLTLVGTEAAEYCGEAESFDLVICIGARPYGSRTETLHALMNLAKPGGRLLIGEGFWRREPDPEFLAFLGCGRDEYVSHERNTEDGVRAGLAVLQAEQCSVEELDDYDGRYAAAIEKYLREHPDDADAPQIRERITTWRTAYFKWLRDTLGFGLYLFRKPE